MQPQSGGDVGGAVLRLFGPLAVERAGKSVALPASRKTRALLGFLVLSPRPVTRQRLCDLFFDVPDDPRAALRWSLHKLRAVLDEPEAERLISARETLAFDPTGIAIDALRVMAIASKSNESLTAADCQEGLALLSGELLEDCELPNKPEFTAWLGAQRQDFHAIALRLARHLADSAVGEDKILHLRRLLALELLDETAAIELSRALIASGRRDEAHELVAGVERQMRQLGLKAGPALRMSLRGTASHAIGPRIEEMRTPSASVDDGRISVAVMPFLNHSSDVIPEDLSDGLLEATAHMVSRFRDIRVASPSASLSFKGTIRDPASVGGALGVSHLVGGSIMVRDGVLKIRYRLVAASDGAMISSGDVEHAHADAFALLEDAPTRLTILLAHHLNDTARRLAVARPVEGRNGFEHLLFGIHLSLFSTPVDFSRALEAFELGLRHTPGDPSLNAYAAWAKAGLGHGLHEPQRAAAIAQAHRAVATADSNADALAIAAWSLVHLDQDFDAALKAVEFATRLNPLSRIVWGASAWIGAMAGEFERPMLHWDFAERCNPLGSSSDTADSGRALCCWMAGRLSDALAFAKRAIDRQPGHLGGHMAAVASAVELGEPERIIASARALLRYFPDAPDTPAMASTPIRDRDTKARLLSAIRRGREMYERASISNLPT